MYQRLKACEDWSSYLIRLPAKLKQRLEDLAKIEGISLNRFLNEELNDLALKKSYNHRKKKQYHNKKGRR